MFLYTLFKAYNNRLPRLRVIRILKEGVTMREKSKEIIWGELLLPAFATAYGIYALLEQYYSDARFSSIYYTLMLAAPVWICGVLIAVGAFRGKVVREKEDKADGANYKILAMFFAGMVAVLALLETLGYIVCFFLFLVGGFRGMGVRSPKIILMVSIGALVFIYFVFGVWLQLALPMGIWPRLFNF